MNCETNLCRVIETFYQDGYRTTRYICDDCEGILRTDYSEGDSHPAKYVMPFGKYKGQALFEINKIDHPYLDWASNKLNNDEVKKAIRAYLYPVKILYGVEGK